MSVVRADVDQYERALLRHWAEIPPRYWAQGMEQWFALGLAFGYPRCCIEAFCDDLAVGRLPGMERWVDGIEYVPCLACLFEGKP